MEVVRQQKIDLSHDQVILPLEIYPKEAKSAYEKSVTQFYTYSSAIHNSKDMKTSQVLIKRRMNKESVVHPLRGNLHNFLKG